MMGGTGAWSNLREGDDINTVSRSQSGGHLSTGDNRGNVSLYRHPCTAERVYRGPTLLCYFVLAELLRILGLGP